MIVEQYGEPDLFSEANDELMGSFIDLNDSVLDPIRDCDQFQDLIIRIHELDNMRRRKLYTDYYRIHKIE